MTRLACKNCENLDKDFLDMFDEAICNEADQVIRLKRGQGRPKWCPLILKNALNNSEKGNEQK